MKMTVTFTKPVVGILHYTNGRSHFNARLAPGTYEGITSPGAGHTFFTITMPEGKFVLIYP